jgi:drug/metabolite transporter (DMT)-like permease
MMTTKLLTISLVFASLVGYQLAQRAMPTGTNPFTLVAMAYLLGMIACAILAPLFGKPIGFEVVGLFGKWQIWALAASVVGIEIGYLLAYRAGWPLATTTGITYTSTMVFLAVIGATFFDESLSLRRIAGLALAIASVWLLVAPSRAPP